LFSWRTSERHLTAFLLHDVLTILA